MLMPSDWKRFVELLNSNDVEYVLIGDLALSYHGYPRLAPRIEFFVSPGMANATKLKGAIDAFQLSSLNIPASELAEADKIFQFGQPPLRIDVCTGLPGVSFDDAWSGKEQTTIDGVPMWVIGKMEFVRSKIASGRASDVSDAGLI
jgi:hypothetical protein